MNLEKEWYRSEFIRHELLEEHRTMEDEFTFYEAIAGGNLEYVQENCRNNTFTDPEGMGKLSDNSLQNLRYHFIVTAAMTTRYCIQNGMEQEKAYSLSDFYITTMDKCTSVQEIAKIHDEMALDFCKQMKDLHNSQVLSKPIVLCIDYIYSHTHYRITISELAEHLGLSKSYLSKLFHKEMGMTISDYITNMKIEKAKNLLQFSEYSIVDISNYLAFSSQSHFIQVFRKKTGVTPRQYRSRSFRNTWEPASAAEKG
jgi:AraC-like DNA-binding protein